jgi:NAD+ kinase
MVLTQEDWGFGNRSKENIDEFLQVVIEKKYTLSKRTLLSLSCGPANEALQDINLQ